MADDAQVNLTAAVMAVAATLAGIERALLSVAQSVGDRGAPQYRMTEDELVTERFNRARAQLIGENE